MLLDLLKSTKILCVCYCLMLHNLWWLQVEDCVLLKVLLRNTFVGSISFDEDLRFFAD